MRKLPPFLVKIGNHEYQVEKDGKTVAYFYREYQKAFGNPRYVGHFAGGFSWELDLADTIAPDPIFLHGLHSRRFDSFKKGLEFLKKSL